MLLRHIMLMLISAEAILHSKHIILQLKLT
uniref:Uncharacterized protein n=1 Tax=Siphoviridae sp. ctzpQ31 TaxID=2823613 RepID=A0A8S5L8R2_9CAUD|nr:MAG TPA: hypothetical protein [Siphoviridae sp. ctzpQ31]DAY03695.1 MAG TPA: hypothetical protein [Bacteriophage sp.]